MPAADEDGPHDECANNAVKKHPMLELGGHGEVREDDDEYEDVVDAQRLLNRVGSEKLHPSVRASEDEHTASEGKG